MLKALGAVQAVSEKGKGQRMAEQAWISETARQIRNGRPPALVTRGRAQGSLLYSIHHDQITVLLAFFLPLSLGHTD